MKRALVFVLAFLLVAVPAAAEETRKTDKAPAARSAVAPKRGALPERAERIAPPRMGATSRDDQIRQLWRSLRRVTRAHNQLVGAHNDLVDSISSCYSSVVPVTQYGDWTQGWGYAFSNTGFVEDQFYNSALDLDKSGSPHFQMSVRTC